MYYTIQEKNDFNTVEATEDVLELIQAAFEKSHSFWKYREKVYADLMGNKPTTEQTETFEGIIAKKNFYMLEAWKIKEAIIQKRRK